MEKSLIKSSCATSTTTPLLVILVQYFRLLVLAATSALDDGIFGGRKSVLIERIDPGPPLYPTDELFTSPYLQYVSGSPEVEEAVIALEDIDPNLDFHPILHSDFLTGIAAATNRGRTPVKSMYA